MLRRALRQALPRHVRRALREAKDEWQVHRRHARSVKLAGRLAGAPLRLNLGCGQRPKDGWINVDLGEPAADLHLDLREPLPFPDASVASIYSEHFFEHLSYPALHDPTAWQVETPGDRSEALSFLRECRRVLVPGGAVDLVVPDAEGILDEYASRKMRPFPQHPWWGPAWCDTPMHVVNYVFRQGREHRYAYDEETLAAVLARAGFVEIRRRAFDPALDAGNHEIGSLCMRAVKPAAG